MISHCIDFIPIQRRRLLIPIATFFHGIKQRKFKVTYAVFAIAVQYGPSLGTGTGSGKNTVRRKRLFASLRACKPRLQQGSRRSSLELLAVAARFHIVHLYHDTVGPVALRIIIMDSPATASYCDVATANVY